MSSKLERIYWLEFLRHRLLAPIAYDRRHNGYWGYRLTDDSFGLPSYWFNPPTLLFLAAACNQLRHLEGDRQLRQVTLQFDPCMARTEWFDVMSLEPMQ